MKQISNEEIYELRKSGMSYRDMVKYFHRNGIKIARNTIASICKRIFAEKGEKEEEILIKRKKGRKGISSEEVYELREKGMSYKEIAEYYYKLGVDISDQTIGRICKEIYKEKGETEPIEIKNDRLKVISNEKFYILREQGMSYVTIAEQFKEDGIDISSETIRRKCKEIYKEKGKKEPETKVKGNIGKKRTDIKDEKIYELREKGMSYTKIAEYYKKEGIEVSYIVIRSRCKRIYENKGKKEPETKAKRNYKHKKTDINDEEIYELRKSGMPYKKIEEYFREKGIIISRNTISKKCKRIFAEKGEKEPETKRNIIKEKRTDVTDDEIYELRKSGMSYKKIVRVFHIRGIKISSNTVASECKRIFAEKGEEETQIKRKEANKQDNLLEKLNNDLNDKIREKINTEKVLAELKDREVRNTKGAEK